MATTQTTTTLATTETDEVAVRMNDTLEALKEAFTKAHEDFDHAEGARQAAAHAKSVAAVWMSRIAYRTATHPDVATKRYPENITGAAKVLGMPVGTLRPYALAGIALHKADRAGLLSVPDEDDILAVEKSFDATTRAQQKEKRIKEAEKKAALEAKARELEALKAANGTVQAPVDQAPATDGTKAPEGPQAPATDQAPAKADQAPEAPAKAPAGPSLEEDVVATAKTLVAQIKKLRADKGWRTVAPKVVAALAEVFPALKA
jgi:hypothetical protein